MKRISSVWIALLGIALGALVTLTVQKYQAGRQVLKTEYHNWRKLNLILHEVEANYVDTVDTKGMTDAAIDAALAKLDPHSVYMPPVELEEAEVELQGNFDGIGIQFNVPNDTAIVIEAIPGGPSEKAGILAGDRLLKVDDKVIAGVKFPQDSMVSRMKGPSGTKVKMTVLRDGVEIAFDIIRGKIPVHSVDAAFMVNDTTGYVKLTKFSRTTGSEFLSATATLLGEGMKRLIFDLRDNTGGYMDQALILTDMFLEDGQGIVYTEGRNRDKHEYKADGKGTLRDVALTVLINESTASSSEIFSGAIQDNDRGVIVGRRSFGKGLVQEPIYFSDGSGLRLTVARYFTPSGRCIQKPYADGNEDYTYDIYRRYSDGEMLSADSIKVNAEEAYKTIGGRTVYGGGGIIPDVFVPMDTTRASSFFIACNRKATLMRFAADFFDHNKAALAQMDDFAALDGWLDSQDIPGKFRSFAASRDGLTATASEWVATSPYMLPQLRALIGRYSKLGDNAFYHSYLTIDDTFKAALSSPSEVSALPPTAESE